MNWIKLTDAEGKVDESKLPKESRLGDLAICDSYGVRYYGHWLNGNFYDQDGVRISNVTHYALITGPDEPQPEAGLVEVLEELLDNHELFDLVSEDGEGVKSKWLQKAIANIEQALALYKEAGR